MHTIGAVVLPFLHVFATYADDFLSLNINNCFERVSIGKRLNTSDVTKTIYNRNLKQCSNECERILCNAYSYGLNGNGNSTCLLSLDLPKSRPYDDPEYDLFMKILQCRDRTSCFNKLVGGRRLIDKYIQRTLPVESKGDCELYCEYEYEFRCEGYNFRYDGMLNAYSSCQLTSAPSANLDLSLDFQSDLDYDYFEKNINASPSCRYLDLENPFGLRRQWAIKPDINSLWQDVNPSLYQKNDVGYGNDKVHYDTTGVLSTTPVVPAEYDGVNLLIKPNNDLFGSLSPAVSAIDRTPVSINECFIKARTGHHLQRENIIKSTNAPSLYGCETICANEQTFTCNIFSYRYTFTSSTDNCHMGDKMIRKLDIFQDLVPDRDCDVFARNELSQPGCQPARNWDTDCFERIRNGLTFVTSIVKFSVETKDLQECELLCLHVKHFTCRAFSFRRGTPVVGKWSDNCYLTDYPIIEMDPVKHLVRDADLDVYNRGSYGRGCELDRGRPSSGWPTVAPDQDQTPLTTYRPPYDVPPPLATSPYGPPPLQYFPTVSPSDSPPLYAPIRPPSTTSTPSTVFRTPPPPPPPTKSTGSYTPSLPPTTFFRTPAEYTPVSIGPPSTTNRQHSGAGVFNDVFADPAIPTRTPTVYGTASTPCYIDFGGTARLLSSAVKKALNVQSEHQCKTECSKARENQYFRCSTLSYFGGYCELSDIELRDLRPNKDYNVDQRFRLYTWDFDDHRCYGSPKIEYPAIGTNSFHKGLEWTWMRFTVNGQPCKSGSFCTQNADMGIWSCPVDHGEWDYCCTPNHKCGYSEGVNYAWCYVGKLPEQWRPCSDKYFPSADGTPHTWPVTYFHRTGPPPTGGGQQLSQSSPPRPVDRDPSTPAAPVNVGGGAENGTQSVTKHEQSLVDQFLSIFSFSSFGSSTAPPSPDVNGNLVSTIPGNKSSSDNIAALLTATNNNNNYYRHIADPVPGFRVVDVRDGPSATVPKPGSVVRLHPYRDRFGSPKKKPHGDYV